MDRPPEPPVAVRALAQAKEPHENTLKEETDHKVQLDNRELVAIKEDFTNAKRKADASASTSQAKRQRREELEKELENAREEEETAVRNEAFDAADQARVQAALAAKEREVRALLHPLPYSEAHEAFKGDISKQVKARVFLQNISNPDYLINRLLVIAYQRVLENTTIVGALECTESDRLLSLAEKSKELASMSTIFADEVASEYTEPVLDQDHTGRRITLHEAEDNVSIRWAQNHYRLQGLSLVSRDILEIKARQIRCDYLAGECLNELFREHSDAAAYCIPLKEFLKIGNYADFCDAPVHAYNWMFELFSSDKHKALKGFITELCQVVNTHNSMSPGFDISKFTEDLNNIRKKRG